MSKSKSSHLFTLFLPLMATSTTCIRFPLDGSAPTTLATTKYCLGSAMVQYLPSQWVPAWIKGLASSNGVKVEALCLFADDSAALGKIEFHPHFPNLRGDICLVYEDPEAECSPDGARDPVFPPAFVTAVLKAHTDVREGRIKVEDDGAAARHAEEVEAAYKAAGFAVFAFGSE